MRVIGVACFNARLRITFPSTEKLYRCTRAIRERLCSIHRCASHREAGWFIASIGGCSVKTSLAASRLQVHYTLEASFTVLVVVDCINPEELVDTINKIIEAKESIAECSGAGVVVEP